MTDPSEDLAFVRSVIENTRRAARVDAGPLLAWGIFTVVGIALIYAFPVLDSPFFWLAVIGLAWGYTIAAALRRKRTTTAAHLAATSLSTLWFSVLTGMTIIGFVGYFSGLLPGPAISPVISALFGIGVMTSAALVRHRWVALAGAAWWIVSIALFFTPSFLRLAVFGGAILVLFITPAAILHVRWPQK